MISRTVKMFPTETSKGGVSKWYPHLEIHQKCSEDSWNETLTETLGDLEGDRELRIA